MISLISYGNNYSVNPLLIHGLSTDIKPNKTVENMSIINDSIFVEIDTGRIYKFNYATQIWDLDKEGNINDYIKQIWE